jgi:hypothetical protein
MEGLLGSQLLQHPEGRVRDVQKRELVEVRLIFLRAVQGGWSVQGHIRGRRRSRASPPPSGLAGDLVLRRLGGRPPEVHAA